MSILVNISLRTAPNAPPLLEDVDPQSIEQTGCPADDPQGHAPKVRTTALFVPHVFHSLALIHVFLHVTVAVAEAPSMSLSSCSSSSPKSQTPRSHRTCSRGTHLDQTTRPMTSTRFSSSSSSCRSGEPHVAAVNPHSHCARLQRVVYARQAQPSCSNSGRRPRLQPSAAHTIGDVAQQRLMPPRVCFFFRLECRSRQMGLRGKHSQIDSSLSNETRKRP